MQERKREKETKGEIKGGNESWEKEKKKKKRKRLPIWRNRLERKKCLTSGNKKTSAGWIFFARVSRIDVCKSRKTLPYLLFRHYTRLCPIQNGLKEAEMNFDRVCSLRTKAFCTFECRRSSHRQQRTSPFQFLKATRGAILLFSF